MLASPDEQNSYFGESLQVPIKDKDDENPYEGCSICGPWWSRPEVAEFSAIVIRCIGCICVAVATYKKFDEGNITCLEMVCGFAELVIGFVLFIIRFNQGCGCD